MDEGIKIKSFTDLKVWQEGHRLVLLVYKTTKKFPREELYSLIDQMKRAAISITSNIAEGFGRHSYKEKIQFYYLAQGSLVELKNQILIARDVKYLETEDFKLLAEKANITHKLLQGLITKSKTFLNHKS
jgi:four helix bundle protein